MSQIVHMTDLLGAFKMVGFGHGESALQMAKLKMHCGHVSLHLIDSSTISDFGAYINVVWLSNTSRGSRHFMIVTCVVPRSCREKAICANEAVD